MSDSSLAWESFIRSDIDGWHLKKLGDLFSQRKETGHLNLPLLAITGSGGVVPRDSLDRRDTSNADKSKYLRICKNDIAYNTMRMWQGVSGLSGCEGIASPAYTICVAKDGVCPQYAAQLFKLPQLIQVFHRNSQGMVDDTLNLKFENFSPIRVRVPPLNEQQKIASILTAVDDVIESTQAKISKLKDLKTGMMQELLTKGIGHTEFKDSPVGRIPKVWKMMPVSALQKPGKYNCVGGPFGSDLTSKDYIERPGVPVIRGTNLPSGFEKFRDFGFVYLTDEKAESLVKNMAYPGDLVFTQRGTMGQVGLIPQNSKFERYVVSQSQMKLTPNAEIANAEYLYQFFTSSLFLRQLELETIATGLPHINLGILKAFNIPMPSMNEQVRISSVLVSLDNRLGVAIKKMEQFQNTKRALMQDLLTGKVRVKVN